MLGWHFSLENRRLAYSDDREIVPGETLSVQGEPALCRHGLHASRSILDALQYAPGSHVWRVEVWGDLEWGDDKFCGLHRKALWGFDAASILERFARLCALDVARLWNPPDLVVKFLRSGDPELRQDAFRLASRAYWETKGEAYARAARAANAAINAARAAADADRANAATNAATNAALHAAHAAANPALHAARAANAAIREKQRRRLTSMICATSRKSQTQKEKR